MTNKIDPILCDKQMPIQSVMKVIDEAPKYNLPAGIACIIENNKLIGIVTDGDIRRALIKKISLDDPVSRIMNKNFISISDKLSYEDIFYEIIDKSKKSLHLRFSHLVDKIIITDDNDFPKDIMTIDSLASYIDITHRKIAVIGLGFVGLTLGIVLADANFKVIGVDNNIEILKNLEKGILHFYETGLDQALFQNVRKKSITFELNTNDYSADVYIISVGTPILDGCPSMDYIKQASIEIGQKLKSNDLVICRSTLPVGTTRNTIIPILERESSLKAGSDFNIAFAPERTVEGKALEECRSLPQIIGGINEKSVDLTSKLFKKITHSVINVNNLETAEMIKLVNNSFRDLKFAFSNELAKLCSNLKIDVNEVVSAANNGYVRDKIPVPSPGVGGYCLTKDPHIYDWIASKNEMPTTLSKYGRIVNESMIEHIKKQIFRFIDLNNLPNNCKIFIAGFAFKGEPETSDIRFSSALELYNSLLMEGLNILGYDPVIDDDDLKKNGVRCASIEEGVVDSNIFIIMNNHNSFRKIPINLILHKMKKPALFYDSWSFFDKNLIESYSGVTYGNLSL